MYVLVYPATSKVAFGQVETVDTITEQTLSQVSKDCVQVLRVTAIRCDELRYNGKSAKDLKSFVWKPLKRLQNERLDIGKRITSEA